MFEKIGQSAEKVVSKVSVSRRGFLGSAAKVAAGVGAALAGLVAFLTDAQAGNNPLRCWYYCPDDSVVSRGYPPCKPTVRHKGMACFLQGVG